MTRDVETLQTWILVCVILAAFCATAFPLLYMLTSQWWSTRLGRALMIQAWSFAIALDATVLFAFWEPNDILIVFWINAFVFTYIAGASAYLTWKMFKHNLIIPFKLLNKERKSHE